MKHLDKSKFMSAAEVAVVLIFAFVWDEMVYLGTRLITTVWHHFDMTLPIDRFVPFIPWTVVIYFGCYIVWGVTYYLCAKQERGERDRFFCADAFTKLVCLVFFILVPTTNVRPEITDRGIWEFLMKFLYSVDPADNLFPSLHCIISWLCWIGVRKRNDISPKYRRFTFWAAVAVCISTLTTRQHVIADVIGGVLLAEVSYLIAGIPRVCAVYKRILSWLLRVCRIEVQEEKE